MKRYCLVIALMLLPPVALARPLRHLRRMIKDEVGRVSSVLASEVSGESSCTTNDSAAAAWQVGNLYLRLNALVGFKLPALASVTVSPQVEMIWHHSPCPCCWKDER